MKAVNSFIGNWIRILWNVMSATGKGYRRPSLKHSGLAKYEGGKSDQRSDKKDGESKIQRMARYGKIGVRS